jgi:hypothetical protein
MAMVNLGNISAVTTQMLGNELGGVVATGVSTLLQSGGSDSLAGALSQLEKFFGPGSPGAMSGGATATGPLAFSTVPGMGAAQTAALTNPFGATQGLQPKMQGLIEGLNKTLDDVLAKSDTIAQLQNSGANPPAGVSQAEYAKQFEMVMDQAIKLHLSGTAGDGIKAQALFQRALGMLSGGGQNAGAAGMVPGGPGAGLSAISGGGGFGAPVGGGGFGGFGASPASSSFAPSGGGGVPVTGGIGGGGGLDAMMSQAEALLRSDSMEAQLAGQRLMQKALRMFELISKLIEKQSEMASKAIAAIK